MIPTALLLPYTPTGGWLGFVPPPPAFFAFLLGVVATYLALVEAIKQAFYRHQQG